MDTKTGAIYDAGQLKEIYGDKLQTKIKEGEIVPVPEGQVEILKKMTWMEKQNWLNVQAEKRHGEKKKL